MMKLFIWMYVGQVSSSYHDGGGLLVAARTLEEARQRIKDELSDGCGALQDEPDHIVDIVNDSSDLFCVFPDAGCC